MIVIIFVLGLLVLLSSFRRSRLGVAGIQGEQMFVDLRDRISTQGNLPDLPREWLVESVATSAGGTSFAGDFIVARRTGERFLDLVVVERLARRVAAQPGTHSAFLRPHRGVEGLDDP